HARDLVALRGGLAPIDGVRAVCAALAAPLVEGARDALADLDDLRALLEAALADEPPLTLSDGGVIRETWNEALHAIVSDAAQASTRAGAVRRRARACGRALGAAAGHRAGPRAAGRPRRARGGRARAGSRASRGRRGRRARDRGGPPPRAGGALGRTGDAERYRA